MHKSFIDKRFASCPQPVEVGRKRIRTPVGNDVHTMSVRISRTHSIHSVVIVRHSNTAAWSVRIGKTHSIHSVANSVIMRQKQSDKYLYQPDWYCIATAWSLYFNRDTGNFWRTEMPRLSKARKKLLDTMMKESIFEATTSVLSEHGVDGTTMNRVAEAADLAKSSLYDYFSEQGGTAGVRRRSDVHSLHAGRRGNPAGRPARAAEARKRSCGSPWRRAPSTRPSSDCWCTSDREQDVKKRTRPQILEAFTTIFEQGVKEGSFHPHNPAHTGRMFMGAFSELSELRQSSASEEAVNEYVEVLIDATLHGVSIHVEKHGAETKT